MDTMDTMGGVVLGFAAGVLAAAAAQVVIGLAGEAGRRRRVAEAARRACCPLTFAAGERAERERQTRAPTARAAGARLVEAHALWSRTSALGARCAAARLEAPDNPEAPNADAEGGPR